MNWKKFEKIKLQNENDVLKRVLVAKAGFNLQDSICDEMRIVRSNRKQSRTINRNSIALQHTGATGTNRNSQNPN